MSQITKKAIEASLNRLLLTKPLDKITIHDIAEDCGINRMTFYYHFRDIYDLVEWSWEEDVSKAIEGKISSQSWQVSLLRIFESLRENSLLIMNVYRCMDHDRIEQYLYKLTYRIIIDVVNEEAQGMDVSEDDKTFIANFYKFAFACLILDWVRNGMKENPESIVKKLSTMMRGSFEHALDSFRKS